MKKTTIILSALILILVLGIVFFLRDRQGSDNLTATDNTSTERVQNEDEIQPNGADEQKRANDGQQQTTTSLEDAVWISSSFFQKSDKAYVDLERNGDLLFKQDKSGLTEVRTGKISSDVVDRAFSIIGSRSVLNTKDTGEGEQLFSQSEWISVAIFTNGNLKTSASAPIEDFPEDFQNFWQEIKSLASSQNIDGTTKAVLFAELVDSKRADSIKNDPRKFYEFLSLTSADIANAASLKRAITTPGRQVPVLSTSDLQKLEEYIRQSNLKSISNEFFITVDGNSYQLQVVEI